ncbi:MAG: hypothetical protein AAFR53_11940 [Pseudomonadota bacterium]
MSSRQALAKKAAVSLFDQLIKVVATGIWALVLGSVAFALDVVREPFIEAWQTVRETPAQLDRMESKIDRNRDDINALQVPRSIFQLSELLTTVQGADACVEQRPCTINTKLRRYASALNCHYLPGSAKYGFIDPQRDEPIYLQRVGPLTGERDFGIVWEPISFSFMTPEGLSPAAEFFAEGDYVDCPGMREGDRPITSRSNPIRIPIDRD